MTRICQKVVANGTLRGLGIHEHWVLVLVHEDLEPDLMHGNLLELVQVHMLLETRVRFP